MKGSRHMWKRPNLPKPNSGNSIANGGDLKHYVRGFTDPINFQCKNEGKGFFYFSCDEIVILSKTFGIAS